LMAKSLVLKANGFEDTEPSIRLEGSVRLAAKLVQRRFLKELKKGEETLRQTLLEPRKSLGRAVRNRFKVKHYNRKRQKSKGLMLE